MKQKTPKKTSLQHHRKVIAKRNTTANNYSLFSDILAATERFVEQFDKATSYCQNITE